MLNRGWVTALWNINYLGLDRRSKSSEIRFRQTWAFPLFSLRGLWNGGIIYSWRRRLYQRSNGKSMGNRRILGLKRVQWHPTRFQKVGHLMSPIRPWRAWFADPAFKNQIRSDSIWIQPYNVAGSWLRRGSGHEGYFSVCDSGTWYVTERAAN